MHVCHAIGVKTIERDWVNIPIKTITNIINHTKTLMKTCSPETNIHSSVLCGDNDQLHIYIYIYIYIYIVTDTVPTLCTVEPVYNGHSINSHLSKTASLSSPNSTNNINTNNAKPLQSTSIMQPPFYKGQLRLARRWLSRTGFTVLAQPT